MSSSAGMGVGTWARRWRERRGLSQRALARRVGRSLRWLVEVENGRVDPRISDLVALARELRADLHDLPGLLLSCAGAAAGPRKLADGEDEMKRRQFLGCAVALAGMAAVDWERLGAAAGAGRPVEAQTVDDLEAITASYARQWKILPPLALLAAVHAHLRTLTGLLPAARGQRLHALASDTAVLAGYLAFQAEDRGRAAGCWGVARQLSTDLGGETHARALIALSALHSRIAHGEGSAISRAPVELLDGARAAAGPRGSRLLRAWALARRAEEHAALGNAGAAARDLAAADASLREPGACADCLIGPANTSQLDGFRGVCAVLLGRYGEAVALLRGSLEAMPPPMVAWRSVVIADLAAALAGLGELEEACDSLSTALGLALQVGAMEHVQRVHGIRRRLQPYAATPAVRRLDDELRQIA